MDHSGLLIFYLLNFRSILLKCEEGFVWVGVILHHIESEIPTVRGMTIEKLSLFLHIVVIRFGQFETSFWLVFLQEFEHVWALVHRLKLRPPFLILTFFFIGWILFTQIDFLKVFSICMIWSKWRSRVTLTSLLHSGVVRRSFTFVVVKISHGAQRFTGIQNTQNISILCILSCSTLRRSINFPDFLLGTLIGQNLLAFLTFFEVVIVHHFLNISISIYRRYLRRNSLGFRIGNRLINWFQ